MAVNYRMGRRGGLRNYNSQPRSRVTVWKPPGEPTPPITPITLILSAGNVLTPSNVLGAPLWFAEADFTLNTEMGETIEFTWTGTEWTTTDEFSSGEGTGTITQAGNSYPAQYQGAEYTANFITAASSVYITAANGVYISWTGVV